MRYESGRWALCLLTLMLGLTALGTVQAAGSARETPRPANDPGIVVNIARVVRSLVFVAGVLVVIHLLGVVSTYAFGHGNVFGLVPFFNLDLEGNGFLLCLRSSGRRCFCCSGAKS